MTGTTPNYREGSAALEAAPYVSPTDAIIDTIRFGYFTNYTGPEYKAMLSCGSVELEELDKGRIQGAARVHMHDGSVVLVQNPHKLCEGLIQAFTPLEREALS